MARPTVLGGIFQRIERAHLDMALRYEYRRYRDMVALFDAGASVYDPAANPNGSYDLRRLTYGVNPENVVPFYDLRAGHQPRYVIGNPEGAERDFHQLRLSLWTQPARWLRLDGWVAWTQDRGNLQTLNGLSLEWREPNGRTHSTGNMPGFSTWTAHAAAHVEVPRVRVRLDVDYWFYSGEYYSHAFRIATTDTRAPRTYVYDAAGRGGYQLPPRHLVDLRVSRDFSLRVGRVGVSLAILNVFNIATVVAVREAANLARFEGPLGPSDVAPISGLLGTVRRLERPLEIHVGLRYDL